jgi:hypothetical protein
VEEKVGKLILGFGSDDVENSKAQAQHAEMGNVEIWQSVECYG